MCRSDIKGPFIKKIVFLKKNKIIAIGRNIEITPKLVGFKFNVYNGKNFVIINVTEKMIGYKFGEFCFTKFKSYVKKS